MFNDNRIIPVIIISDEKKAVPLAKAIWDGGLSCMEITLRTKQAADCIKAIRIGFPSMHVYAGTVLTVNQVDEVVGAGAECVVTPGLNQLVVSKCREKKIPVVPGCCTPTEIEQALSLGIDIIKFFPAEAAGGCKMIRALSAPYGNVRFVPTGGIDISNVNNYLTIKSVLACGGSWMAPDEWIKNGQFENVYNSVKETLTLINQN
ncbi:MAG: bifunctional 4-hydroxy-2-oxoglutarate aldolase/2-dehydro-3-deoxy-phosphogluconate aldolase [Defluviitaleaceae bacterium]|nr:bifunctional 4-hydroxy-2-oxoglutarate aldolase/2-dehydro-3-deoxy-phosphogluconate aldolase [Defluviitaleaceae bacterium]